MERIVEDFEVFVHDGDIAVGAVRAVSPDGKPQIVVYVENAGDFYVPLSAVCDVHDGKVVLDREKLEPKLREAIGRAHSAEDTNISGQSGG
ncbi:MAG: hypothetical protein ACREHF_14510 [Rhizomicrobium sp.]